jgi:hypothetical protein
MRSSQLAPGARSTHFSSTSVSLEVSKATSRAASSWRSSRALMRLPLCPTAIDPSAGSCTTSGCAFSIRELPVVE